MRRSACTRSFSSTSSSNLATRLLTYVLCAAGLTTAAPVDAVPEDADKPINIRADDLLIQQQQQRAVYTGSVQVDQGSLRVNADEMTVHYEDSKVVRIIAEGSPARYRQYLGEKDGNVHASAQRIVYHTREERLDLLGEAHLTQRGNEIQGEQIHYDIVRGKVAAESGNDGPVRVILQSAKGAR